MSTEAIGSVNVVVPREVPFDQVFDRLVSNKIVSTRTELAKLLGVGRAAVSYIAQKRGTTPPEWERRFEDAGFCWRWVATGEGPIYNPHSIMTQGKMVVARRIMSIANGQVVNSERDIELPLHVNYLRMIGINNIESVGYFIVQGDTMAPSLNQSDICIVDMSVNAIDTGQYFLLQFASSIIGVRKIMAVSDRIEVVHDNPVYPPVAFDQAGTIVVGRVAPVMKKI